MSSKFTLAITSVALFLVPVSVDAQKSFCMFAVDVTYPAGNYPASVAMGDLDGDLDLDLAIANDLDNEVSVLLNDGSGVFVATSTFGTGEFPTSVAMGDLDGDLDVDLAVTNAGNIFKAIGSVSVLLNNGDGTFATHVTYDVGDSPRSVAISDLDGDLDRDLTVANFSSHDVSVLLNNGNGSFAPANSFSAGDSPGWVATGDLDGDLDLDLAVTNRFDNSISVLVNNGNGNFALDAAYPTGDSPAVVDIGDLDGDLDLDLAVANLSSDDVSVLLNNGDGTFSGGISYEVRSAPRSIVMGDLDGDLDLDLAVTNILGDSVSVLRNNGDGTFAQDVAYAAGRRPFSVAVGDLDGDLNLDLAVTNVVSDDVSILLNNCSSSPNSVTPDELTVFRGVQVGGALQDVYASDDVRIPFTPGVTLNSAEAPVWLVFDGGVQQDQPMSLQLIVESQACTPGLTTTLEAWNWISLAYDVVDVSETSFNNDVVALVDLTAGISDYAQAGTGAVRTRVGWRKIGLVINYPWEVRLDQMVWIVQ